jgi:hypothetical protein
MVVGMSDDYRDPSGNTEAFRAFAARQEVPATTPQAPAPKSMPKIVWIAIAAVVAIAVVVVAAIAFSG